MATVKTTDHYEVKQEDYTFGDDVYFGTQANYVIARRPNSYNYEDLQSILEAFDTRIRNSVVWESFSTY